MSGSLSVGQRVMYRRLGEPEYRTSEIRAIFPGEKTAELATGEIARMDGLLPAPGYPHPTFQERCKQLEAALAAALAAAFELQRRAADPDSTPDFDRMPTYIKRLHEQLFEAIAKIAPAEKAVRAEDSFQYPLDGYTETTEKT